MGWARLGWAVMGGWPVMDWARLKKFVSVVSRSEITLLQKCLKPTGLVRFDLVRFGLSVYVSRDVECLAEADLSFFA
jgi:hypothetical protein